MQSDDLNTKSWFLLGAAGVCLAWGCCTGADVTQREVCWAPQATFQLSSWISPLEFGSRLLQGAQRPHKSLFDLTHDKLFLLAAT